MATLESIAIRANAACDVIERVLGIELPRAHRNREMLRMIQLQEIADTLDGGVPQEDMSGFVHDSGILDRARILLDSGNWTKAEMEAVLRDEAIDATE